MAGFDDDMIKGFLMALEGTMDACDKVSVVAGQLLASQRENKPLTPSVLNYCTNSSRYSHSSESACATRSRSGGL